MSNNHHFISLKACFSLLFYLIIPSCAIILILDSYPELSKERFITMIYWILPISICIVFLAQCSLFFRKGDVKHYVLNICFVIATLLWVYGLLGGSVVITNQWNDYTFSIHMIKYVFLIILVSIINVLYYTLEWRYYKRQLRFRKSKTLMHSPQVKHLNL